MPDQSVIDRARRVIEIAREHEVTDQAPPDNVEELIALAEKLVGQAVRSKGQNSKHPVIDAILEASGTLQGDPAPVEAAPVAAPEPPKAEDPLASMFADPAPETPAPALGELISLQPGETGLTDEIVDKFVEKAHALEISTDDLIYISALTTGRATLGDLTADMAKVLFNRLLEEGQARLDGKGTFAPPAPITHGSFEGEPIPVVATSTTSSNATSGVSTVSVTAAPVVPAGEAEAPKGTKAEPFKAKYAPNEILGPALKAARERVNLTIEQAAEISKLKQAALAAYEDGAMRPQGKTIALLAECYDCDPDALGQGKVEPTSDVAPGNMAAVADVPADEAVGPRDDPPWATEATEPETAPVPEAPVEATPEAVPAEHPPTSDFVSQQMAFQVYADALMIKAKLPVPQEPSAQAEDVPRDISKLNDEDLRSIHATYHFYYSRAAWLSACEEADFEAADQVFDYEMNRKMLEFERVEPSRSVTLIKAEAAQDPTVKKWADQVRAHRGRLRAYKNLRDIYLATCDRCSREFAVRGMDKRAVS